MLRRLAVQLQSLAKEIIMSRKTIGRLYTNKAQIMSLSTQLTEQLGEQALLLAQATGRLLRHACPDLLPTLPSPGSC